MNASAPEKQINPVADLRRTLIGNGYTPVPVITGDKMPKLAGWQKLTPSTHDVDGLIADNPDHMSTGLLTGELVAIDVDVLDEDAANEIEQLVVELPGSENTLVRQGQAPKTLYLFRTATPREKAVTPAYLINGKKCQVEVMGRGQQVVAFGIHPVTGVEYQWHSNSPLQIALHEVAVIDDETLSKFMTDADAVLARHGEIVKKKLSKKPVSNQADTGDTYWRQTNAAALANISSWVTALFSDASEEAGTGAWRVTSESLGRALQEDLSIHPDGIQDFGEECSETAISLVMKHGGASSATEAAHWLCNRMGIAPESLGWNSVISRLQQLVPANDNHPAEPYVEVASTGLPAALCRPPGVVGDIVDFVMGSARFPSPPLALSAALSFTAALVGRRYKGPTGLRSNVYLVTLAESGFGKEHSFASVLSLARATEAGSRFSEKFIADSPPKSAEGLATRLRSDPSIVIQMDEFGFKLRNWVGRKGSSVGEGIVTSLLELTGKAKTSWGGGDRSAGKVASIEQPCVSLQAVSTGHTFWEALESGDAASGFLPRLILIDAGTIRPTKQRLPRFDVEKPPRGLVNAVEVLAGRNIGGNLFGLTADGTRAPAAIITATYDCSATADMFEDFDDRIVGEMDTTAPSHKALLTRAAANAGQLALIVAVGVHPSNPIITGEIMTWACQVAEHSLRHMQAGAEAHIADSDKQREYKKVRMLIERTGKNGLTRRDLVRRINGSIDTQRTASVIGQLKDAGDVVEAIVKSPAGQNMKRFWASEFLPKTAERVG